MSVYGYIGIITEESNEDQQQEALKEYAINNNVKYTTVFEDKLCKKSFGRPGYMALKQILRRGDIVIIIMWLLGFALNVGGGMIHILIVIAAILFIFDIINERRRL